MKLGFSGAPEVAAPLTEVWPRIVDPYFVGKPGPGPESVPVLDPRHFKVITGFGAGSISVRFGIDVELTEVKPNYFTMKARGQAASISAAVPAVHSPPPAMAAPPSPSPPST